METEECAEAAELLSGLVAAVIILMLVVKPLWAERKKASLADPLPSTDPGCRAAGQHRATTTPSASSSHVASAANANVITVGLGAQSRTLTCSGSGLVSPTPTSAFNTARTQK